MEEPKDKQCQSCFGSGVMPKSLIYPPPPDVKCSACGGTGFASRFGTNDRQWHSGITAIGGHSGHGGGID